MAPYLPPPYPPLPVPYPPGQRIARPTSAWAIAGFIISVLAILSGLVAPCIAPLLLGIMGAAASHAGEHETRGNARVGRPLALIGIVAGWTAPLSGMILLLIVSGSVTGG